MIENGIASYKSMDPSSSEPTFHHSVPFPLHRPATYDQSPGMIRRSLVVHLDGGHVHLDPLRDQGRPDAILHLFQVGGGHGIRLGDDGDQVDTGAETFHGLDVEGFESVYAGWVVT